jgi:glycosyltransferase involved in cell wall biosynthesis
MMAAKLLFDMRGFWVDERVDGGLWPPGGLLYRAGKRIERWLLRSADHVVSLTEAGVREMQAFDYLRERRPPMTVIPTCADLVRFRPAATRGEHGFTLGYVGSVGTWYLFDEALAAFTALLAWRPDARLLVVNRGAHGYIRERAVASGLPMEAIEIRAASHDEVPAQMARMDAGVFFIKPMFSKQASAPTKLGEFLGCGIPCLSNEGVGDMAAILREDDCGVAISRFDAAAIAAGIDALLALVADPGARDRCVQAAARHFSLEEGVRRYRGVYQALVEGQA